MARRTAVCNSRTNLPGLWRAARGSTSRSSPPATGQPPWQVEPLEGRRLLSVALGSDGVLVIDGTAGADHVVLGRSRTDPDVLEVRLGRQLTTFSRSAVSGVVVRAGDGNDHVVVLSVRGGLTIDVRVFAGTGHDRVVLGAGNDFVDAGDGNDFVDCGAGNDLVTGGNGHDRLLGGSGNDQLFGASGDDRLHGGDGHDTCSGGDGRDTLAGGVGDDRLYGEAGRDHCDGGNGNDRLFGGDGNDRLLGGAGNDDLFGESGRDRCDGGAGEDYLVGGTDDDVCQGGTGRDTFSGDDDLRERRDRRPNVDDLCLSVTDLPPAVFDTLQTRLPQAEVLKIERRPGPDGSFDRYELLVRGQGAEHELVVREDGTVDRLEARASPPTAFDRLPEAVRTHYVATFPGAVLYRVDAEVDDGAPRFDVLFTRDGRCHEARYRADGTLERLRVDGIDSGGNDDDDDSGGDDD